MIVTEQNENGFYETESYELEAMIDRKGVYGVLSEIMRIALEKEAHVNQNWPGDCIAEAWGLLAHRLNKHVLRIAKDL